MPEILSVKKRNGVAGQYSYVATVKYEGEPASSVELVGSVYGGTVVLVLPGSGYQQFVSREVMERCGPTLDEAWVRKFFHDEEAE